MDFKNNTEYNFKKKIILSNMKPERIKLKIFKMNKNILDLKIT
jgi:hypothetical protein